MINNLLKYSTILKRNNYLCVLIKSNTMKKDVFNQYVDAIVDKFEIERDELFSNSKKREVVDAKQLLYYLCSIRPMTVGYIQRYMASSGYDPKHPPIVNGIKNVKKRLEVDKDYQSVINSIQNSVFI